MTRNPNSSFLWIVFAASGLMMAHHVAARSVRDALFLSNYPVTSLPGMVVAASVVSLLFVLVTSFAGSRWSPAKTAPLGFLLSALLILLLSFLLSFNPAAVSVVFFLVVVACGSLLNSSFWLLLSERFDPSTLKQQVGRIASSGTAGVILGGILAERAGAMFHVSVLLPVLAALHATVAVLCWRIGADNRKPLHGAQEAAPIQSWKDGASIWRELAAAPYFRPLATLVVLSAIGAGLIDYVFKARAVELLGDGDSLLRFFAVFHTVVGVATFLVQTYASRAALERMGTGRALGSLPIAAAGTSLIAIFVPGLASIVAARAGESILRGSVFRNGYELFYAPMPVSQKRAGKPMIDVGFDRVGEALGAACVRTVLLISPVSAVQIILGLVVLLGIAATWIAWRLQSVYVGVLESNLQRRARDLDLGDFGGSILSSVTLSRLSLASAKSRLEARPRRALPGDDHSPSLDLTAAFDDFRSQERSRVLDALGRFPRLDPVLVPQAIQLLADDSVSSEIVRAIRKVAARHVGQLADALLDSAYDARARQRIPRILAHCRTRRSVDALLAGFDDDNLDVRYQCARALGVLISTDGSIRVDANAVYQAARDEFDRHDSRDARSRRIDYIFILLSLVLPRVPLQVARRALDTDDPHLRGTALEYLESVLPTEVRDGLHTFLGEIERRPAAVDRDQAYKKLMESQATLAPSLRRESEHEDDE